MQQRKENYGLRVFEDTKWFQTWTYILLVKVKSFSALVRGNKMLQPVTCSSSSGNISGVDVPAVREPKLFDPTMKLR